MKDMFLKGGPLMWPLLVCSILSLTITIERLFYWWREKRRADRERLDTMLGRIEAGDIREILAVGKDRTGAFQSLDYIGRILVSGLRHRSRGWRESIEIAAEDEMAHMKRGLNVLDTIITMAPLLGILGTVLGIIHSFDLLGSSGIEDPKAVTGGIAQALITTAAGLAIALVSLIPFNYFVAKVNKATKEINKVAARFEAAYANGSENRSDDI